MIQGRISRLGPDHRVLGDGRVGPAGSGDVQLVAEDAQAGRPVKKIGSDAASATPSRRGRRRHVPGADKHPIETPNTTQITAAPTASDSVTGIASRMSPDRLLLQEQGGTPGTAPGSAPPPVCVAPRTLRPVPVLHRDRVVEAEVLGGGLHRLRGSPPARRTGWPASRVWRRRTAGRGKIANVRTLTMKSRPIDARQPADDVSGLLLGGTGAPGEFSPDRAPAAHLPIGW